MKHHCLRLTCLLILILCAGCFVLVAAQTENSTSQATASRREDISYRTQLQLLVASNIATAKTDYPSSLEPVVKQLKSSLPFKSHYLVATYLYNVAEGSSVETNDITYAPFEQPSGLNPIFFNVVIQGIKMNPSGNSIHLSKFRFEKRQRMAVGNAPAEGTASRMLFDMVLNGITTELNLTEGTPTVVGTISGGLSDGVLVVVLTVNRSR
jgi:hypothetical protein